MCFCDMLLVTKRLKIKPKAFFLFLSLKDKCVRVKWLSKQIQKHSSENVQVKGVD